MQKYTQIILRFTGAILLVPATILSTTGAITIVSAWQNNDIVSNTGVVPGAIFLLLAGIGVAVAGITLLAWPRKTKDAFRELGQWLQQLFTGL